MKKKILLIVLFTLAVLTSCTKPVRYIDRDAVLVLNGGQLREQNASLSKYDETQPEIAERTYKTVNGEDLNACVKAATINNFGVLYLLCNGPDQIIPVDAVNLKHLGHLAVKDLSNPVSILYGGNCLYVANNGKEESYISVHDVMDSYKTTRIVKIGKELGDIAGFQDDLYICTAEGVKAMNVRTWEKSGEYSKPEYGKARKIVNAMNGLLYVSFPDFGIAVIEHSTNRIIKEYPVQHMNHEGVFELDYENKYLYTFTKEYADGKAVASELVRIDTGSGQIESLQKGTDFTALGISPSSKRMYISDSQGSPELNTRISIFNPDNTLLTEIDGGVGTFEYVFYKTREEEKPEKN